jgi:hypothetical protein
LLRGNSGEFFGRHSWHASPVSGPIGRREDLHVLSMVLGLQIERQRVGGPPSTQRTTASPARGGRRHQHAHRAHDLMSTTMYVSFSSGSRAAGSGHLFCKRYIRSILKIDAFMQMCDVKLETVN